MSGSSYVPLAVQLIPALPYDALLCDIDVLTFIYYHFKMLCSENYFVVNWK